MRWIVERLLEMDRRTTYTERDLPTHHKPDAEVRDMKISVQHSAVLPAINDQAVEARKFQQSTWRNRLRNTHFAGLVGVLVIVSPSL